MAYSDDRLEEYVVVAALDKAGITWRNGSRYLLIQCPFHEDKNPSAQLFKDDWFVGCHAGCERQHISKALPELREDYVQMDDTPRPKLPSYKQERQYQQYEMMDAWSKLEKIPETHEFKGIPISVLNDMGWRMHKGSYYIPYFSQDKKTIPFCQLRHLTGDRRFTFLTGAKPMVYGLWNVGQSPWIAIVEGASDAAALEYAGVPWVSIASASHKVQLTELLELLKVSNVSVTWAGDNDEAGNKLKATLDGVVDYKVKQAPGCKDWGEYLEKHGVEKLQDQWFTEQNTNKTRTENELSFSEYALQGISAVFPGATLLT